MTTRNGRLTHDECDMATVSVSDDTTTVFTGPCIVYGVYVDTVLSPHVLVIQDGSTPVLKIPASTAAGTFIEFPGIQFNTSLIVNPNDAASGVISIDYRTVNPGA